MAVTFKNLAELVDHGVSMKVRYFMGIQQALEGTLEQVKNKTKYSKELLMV